MLTRLPLTPAHLYSFDSVNLALALKNFDPTRNQPQPPGYPLFVAEERLFNPIFRTPERTFAVLASVVCGLSLGVLYLLGKRMFSPAIGMIAAAFLFVNPAFWWSGLTSPLRPHIALFSLLVAYFCWRAVSGEPRYFLWASLAFGLGSGFRPELLVVLFPLWAWTAWKCGEARLFIRGFLLAAGSTLLWVIVLAIASGGVAQMIFAFFPYIFSQTQQTSVLLDPRAGTWIRWAGRAFLWNGLGMLPWIWTIPFGWSRFRESPERHKLTGFLLAWFLPAFAFYLLVHIAEPDHALTTIPLLCLAGAYCVVAAEEAIARKWGTEWNGSRGLAVWFTLAVNMMLFFMQFTLPQRLPGTGFRGLQSVKDAVLIGTFESSYARVLWVEQMLDLSLKRIQELKSSANRPVMFVWSRDGEPVWRRICYYLPSDRVVALDEKGDPAVQVTMAQEWSGPTQTHTYAGAAPIRIPIPKGVRIIWLISPATVGALGRVVPLQSAAPLYYTDLAPDSGGFRWGSFEFAPE